MRAIQGTIERRLKGRPPRAMIKNLRIRVGQRGWWPTLSEARQTLIPTKFGIWLRQLTERPKPTVNDNSLTITTGPSAVRELTRLRHGRHGLTADFYRDLIDDIDICVLATTEGRLAGIAWGYDQVRYSHFLRMGPREVEIRSLYSLPEFRGRGVAKAMILHSCLWFRGQGYEKVYAVIHPFNVGSIRAFEAVGFRKIAELQRPAAFGPRYLTSLNREESWREVLLGSLKNPV